MTRHGRGTGDAGAIRRLSALVQVTRFGADLHTAPPRIGLAELAEMFERD